MKTQILNPMPWSAIHNLDGTVGVTISAGPRESVSIKLRSLAHLSLFCGFLSDALEQFRQGKLSWQSPALQTLLAESAPVGAVAIHRVLDLEDGSVTSAMLTRAGLRYDPRSGWLVAGDAGFEDAQP